MTVGQHINLIRNKRNMTLGQLAIISGVSKSTINSWIYYGKHPNLEPLMKVANALEVSLDELVGRVVKNAKKGRWLKTDAYPHRVYCSECYKTYVTNEAIIHGRSLHNYCYCTEAEFCPHCGIEMEGGVE